MKTLRIPVLTALPVVAGLSLLLAEPPAKSGIDLKALDKTCKPCDDFWRFANGSWLDANPIPPSQSAWGAMNAMADQNRERMKNLLDQAAAAKAAKGSNEQKLGDLYKACMDEERAERLAFQPIAGDLAGIESIRNVSDLATYLVHHAKNHPIGPFAAFPQKNVKNTEQTILDISPAGLSLPERDYYFRTDARSVKIREEFVAHVERLLTLAGQTIEVKDNSRKILELETKLAQPMLAIVALRDPYATYHPTTLEQLAGLAPLVNWKQLVANLGIPEGTEINLSEPEHLKALNQLFQEVPLETWKVWLRWQIISEAAPLLHKAAADEDFRFNQGILNGVKEQQPRWKRCVVEADRSLGDALGEKFVAKYFPPAAKAKMLDMVNNIQETLREELMNAAWLSPETRKNALAKLSTFRPKIGYPDRWRDYSSLTIAANDRVGNFRRVLSFRRAYQLSKIGKPRDRNDWFMTAPTVNAYYSPTENEIAFPAGILQPPMFDMSADDAANYGAAGAVIGHEMGHGFDDQGSKFDAEGNLKNWWTDADRQNFDSRSACFVEQFNTLDLGEGQRHNGKLVLGEAMGDFGGLTLAYRAYKRSLKGKPAPPVIDGYTADQRFFLAFARVWGTNLRAEAIRLRLATDPHPIAKWRAIGTLQNMPEFHKAFGCKPGDFMVRPAEKQCRLW
ncbi:MAG: M13 family metallopeptidase [Bryobacter sp.]|nr:M13 family metallopeptidase [Bryobacter sp.]